MQTLAQFGWLINKKRSKLLADRQPDSHVGGVCDITTAGGRDLPAVSEATARAAPARSDSLPASSGDPMSETCSQLYRDAQQTTLMLLEMQRWYERQTEIQGSTNP